MHRVIRPARRRTRVDSNETPTAYKAELQGKSLLNAGFSATPSMKGAAPECSQAVARDTLPLKI
jgi:hypothetical protein